MPISNINNGESGSDARTSLNQVIDKVNGIESSADVTDAGNVGPAIGGATVITTLGDTDQIPVVQSNVLKSLTYSALKTLLGAIYQAKATILGTLGGLANAAGVLTNDGAGNLSWGAGGGSGTGVYRTKNILASDFIPRVTTGSLVNSSETATNDVNYDTTDFDPATTQYAQYWWKTPLEWDAGTIKAKISWAADSGSGDVVWNVSAVAIGDGDALDSAQGTAIAVADTLQSAALNESPATAAITPGGTPVAGKYLVIEVSRDSASGTLATNARLLGVDIQYKESTTPPSSW